MKLRRSISQRLLAIICFSVLFIIGTPVPKAAAQYDDTYISFNDFYDNLAPYGQWIEDPQYGYVWSPNEDANFRPYYTNGYWVMTDYGNTWVSDYAWGWACFHYGRWTYDSYYGWLWIPGNYWGPAWVSWRNGDGYFGWAPLGPGYEFTDAAVDYSCPNDWWVFIPPQYIYSGNYYRYWYGPHGNSKIIHNTVFINNVYRNNNVTYVSGPRTRDIEDITHQPVQVFKIKSSNNLNTRVHNNQVRMYRPAEIRQNLATGQRSIPQNVVTAPQPIRQPQAVNTGQTTPPQFRNRLPNNSRNETPGTNYNQTAEPVSRPVRNDHNPYEWDINRPQPQPKPQPRQQAAPLPAPTRQAPAPARQAPAPAQQSRPAPAQQQVQPRPAPAPAPAAKPQMSGGSNRR